MPLLCIWLQSARFQNAVLKISSHFLSLSHIILSLDIYFRVDIFVVIRLFRLVWKALGEVILYTFMKYLWDIHAWLETISLYLDTVHMLFSLKFFY